MDGKAITDARRKSYYNKIVRDCKLVKGFRWQLQHSNAVHKIFYGDQMSPYPLIKPSNPDSFVVVSEP